MSDKAQWTLDKMLACSSRTLGCRAGRPEKSVRSMSRKDKQLIALAHQSTPLDLMIATSLSELNLRRSVAVPKIIKLKK